MLLVSFLSWKGLGTRNVSAFKAILARRINIKGSEENQDTFARIEESDSTLRFGFKALIKRISYTKQSICFAIMLFETL